MLKAENIQTPEDMQNYCEGCLNDFEAGISTKSETMHYLFEYTKRVMELASGKVIIKSNGTINKS